MANVDEPSLQNEDAPPTASRSPDATPPGKTDDAQSDKGIEQDGSFRTHLPTQQEPSPESTYPPDHNPTGPTEDWDQLVKRHLKELAHECDQTVAALNHTAPPPSILKHGAQAVSALDTVSPLLHGDDPDVAHIYTDTRRDLIHAYIEAQSTRPLISWILLRGVFEGAFTCLLYRQQKMSLRLWAEGRDFDMAHQLFDDKHHFYRYYDVLFSDERYTQQYGTNAPGYKKIAAEAREVYNLLSSSVHKKRTRTEHDFTILSERVLRIIFTFLEREEDLPPYLRFPEPTTYPKTQRGVR